MKRVVISALATAAVSVFLCGAPVAAYAAAGGAGNGGDANGEADQAQLHPMEANQTPYWIPNGVPEGEIYTCEEAYGHACAYPRYAPAPEGNGYGYGPLGVAGAIVAAPFDAAAGVVNGVTGAPYGYRYGAP